LAGAVNPSSRNTEPDFGALVEAILSANLTEELKKAETSRALIKFIAEETQAPPWAVRLVYHWVLVLAVQKLEETTRHLLSEGAELAGRRLTRLAGIPGVRAIVTRLLQWVRATGTRADNDRAIKDLLGGKIDTVPDDLSFASVQDEAALRAFVVAGRIEADVSLLRADIDEQLSVLRDRIEWEPPLDLEIAPKNDESRFVYRARTVPFVGREAQMQALDDFLNSPSKFAWWMIAGGGGSGKSRVALELCLSHGGLWRTGFLIGRQAHDAHWSGWHPLWPTLIVIDYIAGDAKLINQMIVALHHASSGFDWPVRLLLLERQFSDSWWKDFRNTESAFHTHVKPSQYSDPLVIPTLSAKDLRAIMHVVLLSRGKVESAAAQDLLSVLFRIDPQGRPLFAAFVADAVADGRNPHELNYDAVVQHVLEKDRRGYWAREEVTDKDELLVAFVTIAGRCRSNLIEKPPVPELGYSADDRIEARYATMTGRTVGDSFYPLEPGIVGELLVLTKLAEPLTPRDSRARRIVTAAWREHPYQARAFTERAVSDFPSHPSVHLLALPELSDERSRAEWCFIANDLVQIFRQHSKHDHPRSILDRLLHWSASGSDSFRKLATSTAALVAGHIVQDEARVNGSASAERLLDLLRLSTGFDLAGGFREIYLHAANMLVNVYMGDGDLTKASKLFMSLQSTLEESPEFGTGNYMLIATGKSLVEMLKLKKVRQDVIHSLLGAWRLHTSPELTAGHEAVMFQAGVKVVKLLLFEGGADELDLAQDVAGEICDATVGRASPLRIDAAGEAVDLVLSARASMSDDSAVRDLRRKASHVLLSDRYLQQFEHLHGQQARIDHELAVKLTIADDGGEDATIGAG
jgi:hypothetical protein